MATTLDELMIDMETGDACLEDAYIASAKGQINVAHAIFESAYKNYELPDDGQFVCYVESDQEGIPTKSDKAAGAACAAVGKEIGAYLDAVLATAKKVKTSAEKNLKTIIIAGKRQGITMSEAFEKDFAEPLGKSLTENGKLSLQSDKFLKSKDSFKLAKSFVNGCIYTLAAYGISLDIPESVKNYIGSDTSSTEVSSIKQFDSKLSAGGKAFGVKASGTIGSLKASDISDMAMSVYSIANTADAVIKAVSSSAKKDAVKKLDGFCSEGNTKISKSMHSINGDIQKYMSNLEEIGNAITTGFTDSAYALMETISKK